VAWLATQEIGPTPTCAKFPMNQLKPVAVIRSPERLSRRRSDATRPQAMNTQPTARSGIQWRGSFQPN
jgi:hypothetical protein